MDNDGKLTGHSALIAGASNTLGLAIAKLLAAEDCQLHMADTDNQALDLGIAEISELYEVDVEPHLTDLSEPIIIAVLALECQHVNILINTLGAMTKGAINELEHEDWKSSFELTLFAAINLTGEVLESLYEQGSGIIVNGGGVVDGDDDKNEDDDDPDAGTDEDDDDDADENKWEEDDGDMMVMMLTITMTMMVMDDL